jgi:hypothetical protein
MLNQPFKRNCFGDVGLDDLLSFSKGGIDQNLLVRIRVDLLEFSRPSFLEPLKSERHIAK